MAIPAITSYPMPSAEAQPENRVDWAPEPHRAVLLIHDMQQYFLNKYDTGQAPIPELVEHIVRLREAANATGVPVIYTAQPTDQPDEDRALLNDFWGPGLPGAPEQYPIIDALAPEDGDTVLTKWRYSAFQRSPLRDMMRDQGRDQLIICGVYAHIGCMATALEAFMQDVQAFFVFDAVADFSSEEHLMAGNYVAQRCGVTTTTAQVCDALATGSSFTTSADSAFGAANAGAAGFGINELHDEIAELMDMPIADVPRDENLLFFGLDSIRLMSLVEKMRRSGIDVTFVDLVEAPTLAQWEAFINEHTSM
ncbi:isochorismatase family protein [Phytohalomonas tamaricis]|uniref:isochorismatase family protein n=1 Tax=Phytohalomonas tamaricis TaxID=2081032 RepID=UPI000D0B48B5|nr:isochorismatase family protein [Phytohalomonas tamaricis]